MRARDGVPDLDLVGLVLGQDDEAFRVFLRLEVDLDLVADLGQPAAELLHGDGAFALVADVDEDLAAAHVDDAATDDLAFLELVGGDGVGEPIFHAFLGLLVATLLSRVAEGFTVVLLHAAHSSHRNFEARSIRPLMASAINGFSVGSGLAWRARPIAAIIARLTAS